jgi:hypothetical protein
MGGGKSSSSTKTNYNVTDKSLTAESVSGKVLMENAIDQSTSTVSNTYNLTPPAEIQNLAAAVTEQAQTTAQVTTSTTNEIVNSLQSTNKTIAISIAAAVALVGIVYLKRGKK